MKKTKIICTMGPNTNDRELIKQLALNGMDIARFNFSHGDHEEQAGPFVSRSAATDISPLMPE